MNLFFAWVIYSLIAISGEKAIAPRLGDIASDSKAFAAGFRSGDLVESVNKQVILTFNELENALAENAGTRLDITVVRSDGTAEQFTVTPELGPNPNVLAWKREIGRIEGLTVSSRAALVAVRETQPTFQSAAFDAGLRSGDAVLEINGVATTKWRDLVWGIGTYLQPNQSERTIRIKVQRGLMESLLNEGDSTPRTLDFEVKVPDSAIGTSGEEGLAALGFADSELFISMVEKGSPAETSGLKAGDQIVQIDGAKISSFEQVMSAIRSFDSSAGTPLQFIIRRPSGAEETVAV